MLVKKKTGLRASQTRGKGERAVNEQCSTVKKCEDFFVSISNLSFLCRNAYLFQLNN